MEKLEIRFYSLKELKKILNRKRTRDIIDYLEDKHYRYERIPYKGFKIKSIEEITPEERLRILLTENFNLDKRTDLKIFSAFFFKFAEDPVFTCAPWDTKINILKKEFNIKTSRQTLVKYIDKLLKKGAIEKNTEKIYWKSFYKNGIKYQKMVEDNEEIESYIKRRNELLNEADMNYSKAIGELDSINPNRWKITFQELWNETKTSYYPMNVFTFNAFQEEEIAEIYELCMCILRK